MKLKKVGAVLAGAALLGSTFAGVAAGAELDVPDREFFIDETTGLNNCLIVVGSGAAAADVVSASYVAAEIGTMAYTEEVSENWIMPGVTYSAIPDTSTPVTTDGLFEELVDNFHHIDAEQNENEYEDLFFDDFRDAIDQAYSGTTYFTSGPESWVVLPYVCGMALYEDTIDDIVINYPGVGAITDKVTFTSGTGALMELNGYVDLSAYVSLPSFTSYNNVLYTNVPETPFWDYDVYVDAQTAMSADLGYSSTTVKGGNFLVDTGCSYEAITVDFSLRDLECSAEFCTACLAACNQEGLFLEEQGYYPDYTYLIRSDMIDPEISASILPECQTYPNVYPRHYWGGPVTYASQERAYHLEYANTDVIADYCDPVGGIQYRTIVDGLGYDFSSLIQGTVYTDEYDLTYTQKELSKVTWASIVVPSDADDRKETGDTYSSMTTPASEAYLVCRESWPQCVDLYCDPCDVFFLGENYDALAFGTDVNGYDFMFYGTPEWYVEEKLAVGESKEYNGWELSINDLGIYENKAFVTITDPDGVSYDYMVVIDQYTSQSPSDGDGDWDITCDCDTAGINEENDTIAFVQRVFDAYDLCGENEYGVIDYGWYSDVRSDCDMCDPSTYYPDGEVTFAVKFVKTMIGAAGNYVVEYHAYDLVDFGVLKEQIYNGPCETPIDPAISVNGLDWYFDIIPGNGILLNDGTGEILDLDNQPALYTEGNPNFDVADMLTIYMDDFEYNRYEDSGDPDDGYLSSADKEYLRNYYQSFWDEAAGEYDFYTLPHETERDLVDNEYDPKTADEGFLIPICAPMLELWLATPVELAGLCEDELIVELADCMGDNYFTLTVEDEDHTDYRLDGSITISRDVLDSTDVIRTYVDLDSAMLVKLDENIDATLKESYNLILVGGPVANTIVSDLVDLGETTMEMWETSEGDVVMLEDVFAVGKDVLIVAGADRDMTAAAAIALIDAL